jgi:hypothetical protein
MWTKDLFLTLCRRAGKEPNGFCTVPPSLGVRMRRAQTDDVLGGCHIFSVVTHKMVEADGGYRGEPLHIFIPGVAHAKREVYKKTVIHRRHERVNHRIKQFNCMGGIFHHGPKKHGTAFHIVAVITQLSIEKSESLFDWEYPIVYDM